MQRTSWWPLRLILKYPSAHLNLANCMRTQAIYDRIFYATIGTMPSVRPCRFPLLLLAPSVPKQCTNCCDQDCPPACPTQAGILLIARGKEDENRMKITQGSNELCPLPFEQHPQRLGEVLPPVMHPPDAVVVSGEPACLGFGTDRGGRPGACGAQQLLVGRLVALPGKHSDQLDGVRTPG